NVNEEEYVQSLVDTYTLEAPTVAGLPEIVTDQEVEIDVSGDPNRYFHDREGPFYVKGRRIELALPVSGAIHLCRYRPQTSLVNVPKGEIGNHELRLSFEVTHQDPARLKVDVDRTVEELTKEVGWIATDLTGYNRGLEV